MKILAIDTSAIVASCALCEDRVPVAVYSQKAGLNHSQTMLPMVKNLMDNTNVSIDDIDMLAVSAGPGSFTGIRIGVATAKGYQLAVPRKLIAVGSLYMLCSGNGRAIIDAGNGYYYAKYRCKKVVEEPQLIAYDDKRVNGAKTFTNVDEHVTKFVKCVREAYQKGNFVQQLSPIYIRRSQAEENRDKNS